MIRFLHFTMWLIGGVLALMSFSSEAASINQVFTPTSLGAQLSTLAPRLGQVTTIQGNDRSYSVDGCVLTLTVVKGFVTAMGLDVGAKCNPDLGDFLASSTPVAAYPQTFGGMARVAGDVDYKSDCLAGCGNAYDPSLYAVVNEFHTNNFINVVFSTPQVGKMAASAGNRWADALSKLEGDDYVVDGTFNCDGKHADLPAKILKDVGITHVAVGTDLDPTPCSTH